MRTSDRQLLDLIVYNDKKAFNEFYKRYARLLYKWAYNRTKDIETTQEISQMFWENIWLSPLSIKTDENGCAKNFMLRFYTFRILDYLKTKQANLCIPTEDTLFLSLEDNEDLSYSHILEELSVKEIHQIIDETIAKLPEIAREIFHLRWEMEYSVAETANKLHLKEKEIYNRYHRILHTIREKITTTYLNIKNTSTKPSPNTDIHFSTQA